MTNAPHLEKLLPELEMIPANEVGKPHQPVAFYAQAALDLYDWARADRKPFEAINLKVTSRATNATVRPE